MKQLQKWFFSVMMAVSVLAWSGMAQAAERATKEEAVAMVKKAVAFYKANGREKSLAAFSDQAGQFRDRELFLIVLDPKGTAVAHTALKKMIGVNIMDLKDQNGVEIIKSFYKAVEKGNSGWSAEYTFINPATQQLEPKLTYVEKVDDLLIACGYHFLKTK
ncbi:cache domain-containing protein [Undibacterium umbellatum]|uniref:Cache domain-containing protein n=1 Tax=Undibacterium umbellatum TaxID=2762300 RepID=A0ABR6ZCX4_9BURK|nr:cache domain-containing protein [Undibacterium umbellatum]MBC3909600.1 cache domain-containing protein [Undibacterium umbellatum]